MPCSTVDPGFLAAKKLKELRISKVVNVNERQVLQFLGQCRDMLVAATSKLLVKCPLTYTITRNLACMDPCMMATNKDDCVAKFRRVLHKLVFLKQVNEIDCDSLQWEYEAFLDEAVSRNFSKFKGYSCDDQRLDTFLSMYMNGVPAYDKLWQLTKKLLILSHGQATVERGFSVNAQLIVENMKEKSVVFQRVVHNAIANYGGLLKTPVTKSLLSYAASARRKYMAYLEDQNHQRSLQKSFDSKRRSGENTEQLEAG
ncbi:hypothetical protein HOLleu_00178 [Holothuria leucospilota]|uniref:Uncharacterized protein n=1 Tax=Holothuria leucospilota TaxID=206669 RepID=A0A9Q1CP11_HOLLE|nr:hypothetical protein HOLleu_00178 [Holothuria leucospilota]